MSRPIRGLTEGRGIRTSEQILTAFGGASSLHDCDVAEALQVVDIVIRRYSSILSAGGMSLADVAHEIQQPWSFKMDEPSENVLEGDFGGIAESAAAALLSQSFSQEQIATEYYLNSRYARTNNSPDDSKVDES
jgi:5-oxoprolinase (ATP-hydrolysing)